MLDKESIYCDGVPDWKMANELLHADTTEKLENFAKEHPFGISDNLGGGFSFALKDFSAMRSVLIKALEFAAAADDCSLYNPESLKEIGINITRTEKEYEIELNIQLEPCNYTEWIKEETLLGYVISAYPVKSFSENDICRFAASTAFDEIINTHLRNVKLISCNKKMGFSIEPNSAESLWAGVLEKSTEKDSYIGVCKNCGKPFFAEKARSRKRKFCNNGDKCKTAYGNRKKLEKRKEQKNGKNEK